MEQLTNLFKVLSDETRLRILLLLYTDEMCVCQICGVLELSQPKVSRHLAKLRDMGLVKDERKEQFIYYSLDLEDPMFKKVIKDIAEHKDSYPVLQRDGERLAGKEEYLLSCRRDSR